MIEIDETSASLPPLRRKAPAWLLSTILRPARTMAEIGREERPAWHLPLLVLTLLSIVFALVAGPLRMAAAQNALAEPPESFQWMTPQQQEQYLAAQQSRNSPVTTTLFPAIGSVAGVWVSWFVLASILHLVSTMLGSRSTSTTAYNLVAWASVPLAVRLIVQIIAMLTTKQLIGSPGLSGFLGADVTGVLLYLKSLLHSFDIYWIWQFVLLWLGIRAAGGMTLRKAFLGVLIAMLLALLLAGLPGYIAGQFSGLNVTRPFIFF